MIERNIYLNKLIKSKDNGLIKLISGVKGCGKTFLIQEIYHNYLKSLGIDENHILYYSFENTKVKNIDEFFKNMQDKILDNNKYYVFLDDLSLSDDIIDPINNFTATNNIDLYIIGNCVNTFNIDIDKYIKINVYPLSFSEFYGCCEKERLDVFEEYKLYGGFPNVVLNDSKEEKINALTSLTKINTDYILQNNQIKSKEDLYKILNLLSISVGTLTNSEKIKSIFKFLKKSKITSKTIIKYLDYIEENCVVESIKRLDIKKRKYLDTPKKYYFSDIGIRNTLINHRELDILSYIENIVYLELRVRDYMVSTGFVEIVEKNNLDKMARNQLRVDFVCMQEQTKCYIQIVKSVNDAFDEKRALLKIPDCFKKLLVTYDEIDTHYDENGILIVNYIEFLLNPDLMK